MPLFLARAEKVDGILQAPLRLLRSLHFKVAAGVIITVVVLSGLYLAWDYRFYRRQLLSELEQSADALSAVILSGLIRVAMLGDHPQLLQQAIEQVHADASARGIMLLDRSGAVRFSADRGLLGRQPGLKEAGCVECHSGAAPPVRSTFVAVQGERMLRTVTAVPNRRECHPCHAAEAGTIGFLVVDLAVDSMHSKLRLSRNEMLIRAGTTIFAILVVLGVLMNKLVIRRLRMLTAAAGELARRWEDAGVRAVEGADEIGKLGSAFNRMLERLDAYRREVREKERAQGLLLDKIVRIQEEERKRISRELHDHVGQSLSALLLAAQADHFCAGNRTPPRNGFAGAIRKLIDEVHQMAWQMRPSILDDYGLDSALARYAEETSKQHGVGIDYQYSGAPGLGRLPGWVEVTLYRVAQEAVTNVVRHSGAKHASVVLLRHKREVTLLVEDNGRGFEQTVHGNGTKRLGLLGMRERVALCGGDCAIESVSGGGTTVTVRIPLEEHRTCPFAS